MANERRDRQRGALRHIGEHPHQDGLQPRLHDRTRGAAPRCSATPVAGHAVLLLGRLWALSPDTVDDPNEALELALGNPGLGIALGTPATTTLTINDDDEAGTTQFGAASHGIDEGGGTATITVIRTGGTSSEAKVDYAATGGSAAGGGTDYTLAPGTLTFGLGESTRTLSIPISNDASAEGNESVVLALAPHPSGGLGLGDQSSASLWIVDDD